jgi:hypothetical protein
VGVKSMAAPQKLRQSTPPQIRLLQQNRPQAEL